MLDIPFILLAVIIISIIFDYTNGAHDAANAIATIVSTNVLAPGVAVIFSAVLNFAGAFLGTEVATTIGKGIINPEIIQFCKPIILSALIGAILWNIITWMIGLPSSSSHALIGGLIGSAIAYSGFDAIQYESILQKVLIPLFASPLIGFIGGYLFLVVLSWLFAKAKPNKSNLLFKKLQIVAGGFMSLSHGMNDAQKTMGIITLALFLYGQIPSIEVPLWVKFACAGAMFLGTSTGGWKIIKTMGHKIFKLEPIHGFAVETSAALVITSASLIGSPISTTHVISSATFGVGSAQRLNAVRWQVARDMITAWVLTIPLSALMGAIILYLFLLLGIA